MRIRKIHFSLYEQAKQYCTLQRDMDFFISQGSRERLPHFGLPDSICPRHIHSHIFQTANPPHPFAESTISQNERIR